MSALTTRLNGNGVWKSLATGMLSLVMLLVGVALGSQTGVADHERRMLRRKRA